METIAERGSADPQRQRSGVGGARNRASEGPSGVAPEQEGRLSNPVQRRLTDHDVDVLCSAYRDGSSIDSLAERLGVNRTTIINHLARRCVERRKFVRKMTDRSVRQAARSYEAGESFKVVAVRFDVDARTAAREFEGAGIKIRPRHGWSDRA